MAEDFEVPEGYYIDIHSSGGPIKAHYENRANTIHVGVYKSLDRESKVEHVKKVGNISVWNSGAV